MEKKFRKVKGFGELEILHRKLNPSLTQRERHFQLNRGQFRQKIRPPRSVRADGKIACLVIQFDMWWASGEPGQVAREDSPEVIENVGEPRRTRTSNPLIKSQLLYH